MAHIPDTFRFFPDQGRFEMELEGFDTPATTTFQQLDPHTLNIIHTEVPLEARGKGFGSKIIELVVAFALEKPYRLIPTCPVLARYLKRNPEFRKVLQPIQD